MYHSKRSPVRVLHVTASLNKAGIETWLLRVLKEIDREKFKLDFLIHEQRHCDLEDEICELGSNVYRQDVMPRHLTAYARSFRKILKQNGPYDVVHSHMYDTSAFIMALARLSGVPLRISHSHSDRTTDPSYRGWRRRLAPASSERLKKFTTHRVAGSHESGVSLFGSDFKTKQTDTVLHYGMDLTPFTDPIPNTKIRSDLVGEHPSLVIGHVGRFAEAKNHQFLIQIVEACKRFDPEVKCVLIGAGPLQSEVKTTVSKLGLEDQVVFAGLRTDIPEVLTSAIDIFVFPSVFEGLPLALVEAQAAGLPCIVADNITREADIVPGLITRHSLEEAPEVWARTILNQARSYGDSEDAVTRMKQTGFNIEVCVQNLCNIYSTRPYGTDS